MSKRKLNILDIIIAFTVILSATGFFLVKAEITPLNKIIEGKEEVGIVVYLPGVHSKNQEIFKTGDQTSIIIRNKPYKKLLIKKVIKNNTTNMTTGRVIQEINDYEITLTDTAFRTKDGFVINGSKLKIGTNVDLEGFSYIFSGKIIGIYPVQSNAKN